nr:hypothetical protein [Tanacetum cinerariifolium]
MGSRGDGVNGGGVEGFRQGQEIWNGMKNEELEASGKANKPLQSFLSTMDCVCIRFSASCPLRSTINADIQLSRKKLLPTSVDYAAVMATTAGSTVSKTHKNV